MLGLVASAIIIPTHPYVGHKEGFIAIWELDTTVGIFDTSSQ
jgi:hypothetical protein